MYRILGALPVGTDGFPSSSFTKSGSLHLPSSISLGGFSGLGSCLSAEGGRTLPYAMHVHNSIEISAYYALAPFGLVHVSLSLTDGFSGLLRLNGTLGYDGVAYAEGELAGGRAGFLRLGLSAAEKRFGGGVMLHAGLTGHAGGVCTLISVIDADEEIKKGGLEFLLNSKSHLKSLVSARINFYGSGIYADFTASITGRADGFETAEFVLEGERFSFLIEEKNTVGNTTELWGRALQALNDTPYKPAGRVLYINEPAASIAKNALWCLEDYTVSLLAGEYTEVELLKLLAEEAGAELRICADGVTRIVDPYAYSEAVRPSAVFGIDEAEEGISAGGVCVYAGFGAEPVIEAAREASVNDFSSVAVFSNGKTSITTDAVLLQRAKRQVVLITEEVYFTGGTGVVSYPVFQLVSGAESFSGRSLYISEAKKLVRSASYLTLREDCRIYENAERTAVLSAEAVKNVYCTGTAELARAYTQKLTDSPSAAQLRAKNTLNRLSGGRFLELTHLFSKAAARGEPVAFQTEKGTGVVVSSSAEITASPLKIIHKTKLYCTKEQVNG